MIRWLFWLVATMAFVLYPSLISAGTITVAWNPVDDTDLAGYRVYYGTSSASYSQWESVPKEKTTCLEPSGAGQPEAVECVVHEIDGLEDCRFYYLAVKAVDANGNESVDFSNEISGLSAPLPQIISPSQAKQGTGNLEVHILGANFDTQARPDFGPDIVLKDYNYVSCNEIRADIIITDAARVNTPPALPRSVSVTNQDGPRGDTLGAFSVLFNERRADIDNSGRVMGRDLLYLSYAFGSVAGDPNYDINSDLNGDGVVDGADYALLAIWHGKLFF